MIQVLKAISVSVNFANYLLNKNSLLNILLNVGAILRRLKKIEGIDFNEILQMIKAGEEGKLVDVTDEEKSEKVEIYVE